MPISAFEEKWQGISSGSYAILIVFLLLFLLPSSYAWWNTDWSYRKEITLNTSSYLVSNVTNDHAIPVKQTSADAADFWTNVQATGSDVRFIAADDSTELDYYFELFSNGDQNMVAWVEFTDTFTSAGNVNFYMYYGNATVDDGQDFNSVSSAFPNDYEVVWDFNESTGTTAYNKQTKNSYDLTHTNTPDLAVPDGIDGAVKYKSTDQETSSNGVLLDTDVNEFSISFWTQFDDGWDTDEPTDQELINKTNGASEALVFRAQTDGVLLFRVQTGATYALSSSKVVWDANSWYHILGTYSNNDNNLCLYINGYTGDGGTMSADGDITAGTLQDFFIASQGVGVAQFDGKIDQVEVFPNRALSSQEAILLYRSQNFDLQSYGGQASSTGAETFDLNITSLDGDLFAEPMPEYAYSVDGNLTIDFNIFDVSNSRHVIALYYSDQNALTGGTSIVTDWNLSTGDCESLDWYASPVTCSWDWNIHRSFVPDGNYILRISSGTVNKITSIDFNIANDVNLVIKRPIDEDTATVIDYDKYTWSVRVTNSDGLNIYSGQIDENGFILPIGETSTIEIDTNTDDYFSRIYSISYESAQAFDELQPYLVSQATSGNFIFSVTNAATLAPVYDVEIQITGSVGGAGGTGLQTITTDSAGLATISLRLDTDYTVGFYYSGELVYTAYIRPTTSSLFYQVQLDLSTTTPEAPDYGAIKVDFFPTTLYLYQKSTGAVDINMDIYAIVKTIDQIRVQVFDNNGCRYDDNVFNAPWTDGNAVVMSNIDLSTGGSVNIYSGTPCSFDEMFSVYVVVDVNMTDGNSFKAISRKYQLVQENNYKYNISWLLSNFGDSINGGSGNKIATTFIAFLVLVVSASAIGSASGGEPVFAALLVLGELGLFVLIGFVEFMPFVFICTATFFGILYIWGRTG